MAHDFSSFSALGALMKQVDELKRQLEAAGIEMYLDETGRWFVDEALGHLEEVRVALRNGRAAVDPRTRKD